MFLRKNLSFFAPARPRMGVRGASETPDAFRHFGVQNGNVSAIQRKFMLFKSFSLYFVLTNHHYNGNISKDKCTWVVDTWNKGSL